MGSVDREDVSQVTGICIKCQACIKSCPNGAKYFTDEAVQSSGGHHPGHHGRRVQPDAETVLRRAAGAQQGKSLFYSIRRNYVIS